jgi:dTDP-4-amino-4,6-dideoxygalactose transaminase
VSPHDVLSMNSCTSALDLALHLCGVGGVATQERGMLTTKADTVISTPMTCSATNSPIVTRGGAILWADVDPLTGLIDPQSVADIATWLWEDQNIMPSAIMAVDWGGHLADYPALRQIVIEGESIPIIQDAAHSFGATVDSGVPFLDTTMTEEIWRGHFTCFSFQAIKHLTTGDGGALVCPSTEMTERARLLRWYGLDRRGTQSYRCEQDIAEVGYKYHMNDIAAMIGCTNLEYVEATIDHHRANANYYGEALRDLTGVVLPPCLTTGRRTELDATWWLFTLIVSDRDSFIAHLRERGIEASPVHARNDHHTAFRKAEAEFHDEIPFKQRPGVDFFAAHEVAIPVGWWLAPDERDHVVEAVQGWSREHGRDLVLPKPTTAPRYSA